MGLKSSVKFSAYPEPPQAYGWRIYLLAVSASFGAGMFGYDVGVVGGAITLPSFKARFGLSPSATTDLSSRIVSTFLAGAFFGAAFVLPVSQRFGGRVGILLSGVVFLIGSILTIASPGIVGLIYAGRALTGVGVGISSLLVPVYIAECSPPALRGRLVGLFEAVLQFTQIIGFFINYGVSKHISPTSDTQWRWPFGLQVAPAVLVIAFMLFQPTSPRFLVQKGQVEQAEKVLAYLRNIPLDHPYINTEVTAIQRQLDEEISRTNGDRSFKAKWTLVARKVNLRRLGIGFALMTYLALTGVNSINYFSPTIIQGLGFHGTNVSLLATGIYGIVRAVICTLFLYFLVDRFGRRIPLIVGSAGAAFSLLYIAIYAARSHSFEGGSSSPSAGAYTSLVFIYIFAAFLAISWSPIPWLYCAEIFPPEIRPLCTVFTTQGRLVQFAIVYATPYMVKDITYWSFVFFGVCTSSAVAFIYFVVPDTRGIALEDMDILFTVPVPARKAREETLRIIAARDSEPKAGEASSIEDKA